MTSALNVHSCLLLVNSVMKVTMELSVNSAQKIVRLARVPTLVRLARKVTTNLPTVETTSVFSVDLVATTAKTLHFVENVVMGTTLTRILQNANSVTQVVRLAPVG